MRFGLLGPLRVVDDTGTERVVAAPRQRTLLAVLLLHANQPVSTDTLADAVWDGVPPRGYPATLRSYVMRLRRALGFPVAARLATRDPGYLVRLADRELDVSRFEQLCQDTGSALRAGAWADASGTASVSGCCTPQVAQIHAGIRPLPPGGSSSRRLIGRTAAT